MNWKEHIAIDPAVLAGKAVIHGTRLAVDFMVGVLAQGWTEAEIIRNYPGVRHDDIAACLQYASEELQAEKVYPLTSAQGLRTRLELLQRPRKIFRYADIEKRRIRDMNSFHRQSALDPRLYQSPTCKARVRSELPTVQGLPYGCDGKQKQLVGAMLSVDPR